MGVNKALPHVHVLPEDDANRQLALGFFLEISPQRSSQIKILPVAGGWTKVRDSFLANEVGGMEMWPQRHVFLLVNFDKSPTRLADVMKEIPAHLRARVYVLGVWSEPEDLKLGSKEKTGKAMARDCREETATTWDDPLLRHNADELARLRLRVRPILLQP